MTQTIIETITQERKLKPSEVYYKPGAKENIEILLSHDWEILGFRQPRAGEQFILEPDGYSVGNLGVYTPSHGHGIRFIVRPRKSATAFPEWE